MMSLLKYLKTKLINIYKFVTRQPKTVYISGLSKIDLDFELEKLCSNHLVEHIDVLQFDVGQDQIQYTAIVKYYE